MELFLNRVWATLASGINNSQTNLPLTTGHGARFGTIGAGDKVRIVFLDATLNVSEIVYATAVSGDTLTITRGQDGTIGATHLAGDRIECRIGKSTMDILTQKERAGTDAIAEMHIATSKETPVDADEFAGADSAATFGLKRFTWANIKATLVTTWKDTTGGFVGMTLFKINFKNAANTFTSFFTNSNTAARTYTFQNRDGTIADNTDISGAISTASSDATTKANNAQSAASADATSKANAAQSNAAADATTKANAANSSAQAYTQNYFVDNDIGVEGVGMMIWANVAAAYYGTQISAGQAVAASLLQDASGTVLISGTWRSISTQTVGYNTFGVFQRIS